MRLILNGATVKGGPSGPVSGGGPDAEGGDGAGSAAGTAYADDKSCYCC